MPLKTAHMVVGIDLANNYPIILVFLVLVALFLGWKWWNERDAVDVGLKIQEKVREMLGELRCTINGDQVSCKRGFANLGKNFSLREAVDMVVRTMSSRLTVMDPMASSRAGQPPQRQQQPFAGGGGGAPMGVPGMPMGAGGGAPPPEAMSMPPPSSAEPVSPSLGGNGGFGGLEGAGGFGGPSAGMGTGGGSLAAQQAAASQQHMGSGGRINPGTSGPPPSMPSELQPIETSVRSDGPSMGGMGGMGGSSYDPDGF